MSANRSVQAAQRRRAGPTNAEPAIPGRGPQPSIHSSKVFAGQQQQQQQQQQPDKQEPLSSVNKMTIAQAITLITLRLGSVETKLLSLQENGLSTSTNTLQMDGHENMVLIDKSVVESITNRLDSLEKRSSGQEINLLKQQVETIKQAIMKSNNITNNLVKENKDLKTQVENLKTELFETRELLNALQSLTMDNSQKLLGLAGDSLDFEGGTDIDGLQNMEGDDFGSSEIVGTNLKELIESEMNN